MALVKDGKEDFTQEGLLQQGREIRLNSKYNKDSWRFIAKEQSGVSGWNSTKKKCQGQEDSW